MKKILEFPLKDNYEIEMPENAEILTIQVKGTQAYIYVMADSGEGVPTEIRKFMMITSEDEDIPEKTALKMKHIGSFQVKLSNWGEIWVFHVFELIG